MDEAKHRRRPDLSSSPTGDLASQSPEEEDFHRKISKSWHVFSGAKSSHQTTTIYHAIHHNFTTNYHHESAQNVL
jgi:hypothetical protein